MTSKLILEANGMVVYMPAEPITPSTAELLKKNLAGYEFRDLGKLNYIMGEPIEIIDNRAQEPANVTEVVLREAAPPVL